MSKSLYTCWLSVAIFFMSEMSFSQVGKGAFFMKNFSPREYNMHPTNFAVLQDDSGSMYFGNAYGLMVFNGTDWFAVDLPDSKSALSLAKDSNGRIYVGSSGEIGYVESDPFGKFHYVSLFEESGENVTDFEQTQKTYCIGDQVIFVSLKKILIYSDGHLNEILPLSDQSKFTFSAVAHGTVYVMESGRGLKLLTSLMFNHSTHPHFHINPFSKSG